MADLNKILAYLRNPSEYDGNFDYLFDNEIMDKAYEAFIKSNAGSEGKVEPEDRSMNNPEPAVGQIWLCKTTYKDSFNTHVQGQLPYYVLIVTEPEQLGEITFSRVRPISPFIEFKGEDDVLVEDESITSFKFIIEEWNEQPINTDILDTYIGSIDVNLSPLDVDVKLSKEQIEFRKLEIDNTAYLRHSIQSYLSLEERKIEVEGLFSKKLSVYDSTVEYSRYRASERGETISVKKEKNASRLRLRKRIVYVSSVAAALIITVLIWQPFKSSDSYIFDKYATVYPNEFILDSSEIKISFRGDDYTVRGIDDDGDRFDLIANGLEKYNKQEFDSTALILQQISKIKEEPELLYFLSIAQMKSGEINTAIENLEFLKQDLNFTFFDETVYYLALAYIENGERGKARELLRSIKRAGSKYEAEAEEILNKLRWF